VAAGMRLPTARASTWWGSGDLAAAAGKARQKVRSSPRGQPEPPESRGGHSNRRPGSSSRIFRSGLSRHSGQLKFPREWHWGVAKPHAGARHASQVATSPS